MPAGGPAGRGGQAKPKSKKPKPPTRAERKRLQAHGADELRAFFDTAHSNGRVCKAQLTALEPSPLQTLALEQYARLSTEDDAKGFEFSALIELLGDTRSWLEHELSSVIGLETLKQQLWAFYLSLSLDAARREAGHAIGKQSKFHMIFRGNPGTGKTTMGRLMARLLFRLEITPTADLVEVQRADLVAAYVGQTAPKTREVIEKSKSGLLFVDEAYRLAGKGDKDFGPEAIEELMAAMNSPPGEAPVMVFAGYTLDMATFLQANEGLYRRFPYTFDFSDYTATHLAHILELTVKGAFVPPAAPPRA